MSFIRKVIHILLALKEARPRRHAFLSPAREQTQSPIGPLPLVALLMRRPHGRTRGATGVRCYLTEQLALGHPHERPQRRFRFPARCAGAGGGLVLTRTWHRMPLRRVNGLARAIPASSAKFLRLRITRTITDNEELSRSCPAIAHRPAFPERASGSIGGSHAWQQETESGSCGCAGWLRGRNRRVCVPTDPASVAC